MKQQYWLILTILSMFLCNCTSYYKATLPKGVTMKKAWLLLPTKGSYKEVKKTIMATSPHANPQKLCTKARNSSSITDRKIALNCYIHCYYEIKYSKERLNKNLSSKTLYECREVFQQKIGKLIRVTIYSRKIRIKVKIIKGQKDLNQYHHKKDQKQDDERPPVRKLNIKKKIIRKVAYLRSCP